MAVHDIEAMSFDELKTKRDATVESLTSEPPAVLAARYVKALMDAKHRDEKLGEQGKTIVALQDGMEAAKQQDSARIERLGRRTAELADTRNELESTQATAAEQKRALDEQVNTLKARRAEETERANRLKAEALRNHSVLSQAAKLLNDALAAQAVHTADTGE